MQEQLTLAIIRRGMRVRHLDVDLPAGIGRCVGGGDGHIFLLRELEGFLAAE